MRITIDLRKDFIHVPLLVRKCLKAIDPLAFDPGCEHETTSTRNRTTKWNIKRGFHTAPRTLGEHSVVDCVS